MFIIQLWIIKWRKKRKKSSHVCSPMKPFRNYITQLTWTLYIFFKFKRVFFFSLSLVTAVPVPLISWLDWEEVTGALVLHLLREAQEDPEVDVSHSRSVRWPWMDHRRHWHNHGKPQLHINLFKSNGVRRVYSVMLGKVIQKHVRLGTAPRTVRTFFWMSFQLSGKQPKISLGEQ